MTLILNGAERELPEGTTLAQLVEQLELDRGRIAAELNKAIVTRANYAETVLKPGDRLEIVTLVGGG